MDFIKTYLDSVKQLECPESYHIFTAIGLLSSLCGKKVWSKRGAIQTHPNTLVCLIGEPGSGKTTTMRLARNLLSKVPGIKLASKCPSAQAFMLSVHGALEEYKIDGKKFKHSPISIFLSELDNFINLSPELMIPFITDAYDDSYFDYHTLKGGEPLRIEEPVLSGVVCCTLEWITREQEKINFNDGIGRRFLWLLDHDERRDEAPEASLPPELLQRCLEIRGLNGEFEWSDEAKVWWKKWYHEYDRAKGQLTRSYYSTKHVHLEKVAMILAMSNRLEKVFRVEDFEGALSILELLEKNLHKVFENLGRNELHPVANRAMDFIKNQGKRGTTFAGLRSYLYQSANSREIEDIINHLVKSNTVDSTDGRLRLENGSKE